MSFTVELPMVTENSWRRCVWGTHPFPSRTRRLRPRRPMVLHWRRCGRAGGCRIPKKRTGKSSYKIKQAWIFRTRYDRNVPMRFGLSWKDRCQPTSAGKCCFDNWFYQWLEIWKEVSDFWWLIKYQSDVGMLPAWTCTLKTAYTKKIQKTLNV